MLERDDVWKVVDKTTCISDDSLGPSQKITITFEGGKTLRAQVKAAKGVDPALTSEEIVEKWRLLTKGIIDEARRGKIEKLCLGLESLEDVMELEGLLSGLTKNPIA